MFQSHQDINFLKVILINIFAYFILKMSFKILDLKWSNGIIAIKIIASQFVTITVNCIQVYICGLNYFGWLVIIQTSFKRFILAISLAYPNIHKFVKQK